MQNFRKMLSLTKQEKMIVAILVCAGMTGGVVKWWRARQPAGEGGPVQVEETRRE